MVITEVINDTNGDYMLKEGTGGHYRLLCKLERDGGEYSIKCDPNATYREYWVGTDEAGVETTITSDDCVEFSKIVVRKSSKTRKVETKRIKRDGKDWTEVLNNSGHECDIFQVGVTDGNPVGKLKKDDGRFFIFSDDPENAESFSNYRVVMKRSPAEHIDAPAAEHIDIPAAEHIDIPAPEHIDITAAEHIDITADDCVKNEKLIIRNDGGPGKLQLQLHKQTPRGAEKSKGATATVSRPSTPMSRFKSFFKIKRKNRTV